MKGFLFALTLATFSAQATGIKPEQAANYVGKTVVVEGPVASMSHSAKSNTTFINFCAPFPKSCFSAVIFKSAQKEFADIGELEGKTVDVSGKVRTYQGTPEIILDHRNQLRVK